MPASETVGNMGGDATYLFLHSGRGQRFASGDGSTKVSEWMTPTLERFLEKARNVSPRYRVSAAGTARQSRPRSPHCTVRCAFGESVIGRDEP